MPRVTQEHLDSRRRQILDAARTCFIENGFHATSMQHILKASGLSAGAVYRYFPSKESIVAAIAADSLTELTGAIEAMAAVEPPPPLEIAAERLTRMVLHLEKESGFARLVVQLWGEAVRNPQIKAEITGIITSARQRFNQLIQAHQRAGTLDPGVPAADITATLVSLFPGFVLQHVLIGDVRPQTFRNGVRAIVGSAVS